MEHTQSIKKHHTHTHTHTHAHTHTQTHITPTHHTHKTTPYCIVWCRHWFTSSG